MRISLWFKNGDHPLDYSKSHDGFDCGELRVFTGEERKANEWEGDIVRYFRSPNVSGESTCKHCGLTMHVHGWIDTLEGGHIVCPSDWIITGINGEHYPCKTDIFDKTYDPVLEQTELLTFGDAIQAAKQGHKVARRGWSGRGMWVIYNAGSKGQTHAMFDGSVYKNHGVDECEILPNFDMYTVNLEGRRAMLVGWAASQTDMLANDWAIIN